MRTITHRELRNNSSRILREVQAGEVIQITNNGEVAAVLIPPRRSYYERLVAAGRVRPAAEAAPRFQYIRRGRSSISTADIIRDVRGDR